MAGKGSHKFSVNFTTAQFYESRVNIMVLKWLPGSVFLKNCSEKLCKIHRKPPEMELVSQ